MSEVLLTGSRVYGPVTENSDIDVVLFKTEANKLLNRVTLLGLNPEVLSDYGDASSFKFVIDGLPPINIIVVEDEVDWLKWEFATNEMKALEPIVDRNERLQMFHFFQMEGLDRALKVRREGLLKEYVENTKDLHTEFMESAEASSLGGFPQSSYQAKVLNGFVDVDDDVLPPFIENASTCTVPGINEYVVGKCPAAQTIAEAIDARELAYHLDRIDDAYDDNDNIPF